MPHATRHAAGSIESRPQATPAESVWSLAAFWLVAFAAVGLFAAVLIAPKWEQRLALATRVRALAAQCTYMEELNTHLGRVIDAFKHDPEFTEEVARYELGYAIPDEERLPAPVRNWKRPKPPQTEAESPDMWTPFIRLFAHDRLVRQTALITAAVFIVVALAFFNTQSNQ